METMEWKGRSGNRNTDDNEWMQCECEDADQSLTNGNDRRPISIDSDISSCWSSESSVEYDSVCVWRRYRSYIYCIDLYMIDNSVKFVAEWNWNWTQQCRVGNGAINTNTPYAAIDWAYQFECHCLMEADGIVYEQWTGASVLGRMIT